MSPVSVHCPYCSFKQDISDNGDYRPFYVHCDQCAERFIAEPVRSGVVVYRDGEAPCCSDPECREIELGDSGQE